jgi:uncharacterized protein YraI
MSFTKRRLIPAASRIAGLVLAVVLAASGLRVSAQAGAGGRLRFVHAVPGAPSVDISVDKALAVHALDFANASRFLNVTAGDHTITITGSDSTTQIFQGKVSVSPGQAETVIAQGTATAVETGIYEDDLGPVAFGNTRLTASHAIKDAAAVDVLRGDGSPLIQGLKYNTAYGAFDIPATAVNIVVVPAGGDASGAIVKADNVSLVAGTHNRLVAIGSLKGGSAPSYLLLTAAADPENAASSSWLSVVHANPTTSALDVYIGDKLVAPALMFGKYTPHIALAAGSVDLALRAAGSPANSAPIAKQALTLVGGKAMTVVISGAEDPNALVLSTEANVSTLAPNKARIHVINASGDGTATAKLGGVTAMASTAKPDAKGVEVPAGIYDLTVSVDNPALQATARQALSGGVLYDIVIAGNSKLIVAATGLNEQPGSVPTESGVAVAQAPTTVPPTQAAQPTKQPPTKAPVQATEAQPEPTLAPSPTEAPTAVPPTEAPPEPTETQVPPTRAPAPAQGITAIVNTNEGVNLKIREYPRIDAKTLALVPSGATLTVTGVKGPIPPTGQPTPTGTPGPTPTISTEGVTIDSIWLFVTWTTSDGGTVTGWVNAPYVTLTRNGKPVKEIADILAFKQIPANTPGEFNTTAVTPVGADANQIIGTVTVNEGTNLQLRRTPGIDGESLALVPAGAQLVVLEKTEVKSKGGVVGEPASTIWLLVRYATDTGTIVGWVNMQYVQLTRNQRKIDISEVPTSKEITRGFIEGNATPVKPPAPPGIIATVDKVNQGANLQLRRQPDATSESLALIPSGTELPVLGRNGDGNWLQVRFEDKEGWVNSQYVTVTKGGKSLNIADITVVTGEKDTSGSATPGPSPTTKPTAAG